MAKDSCENELRKLLRERIVILDGAMGTTIRGYGLDEQAARGERFSDSRKDLLNNGDILSLTQPGTIADIHKRFLRQVPILPARIHFQRQPLPRVSFLLRIRGLREKDVRILIFLRGSSRILSLAT